ncbi:MAG: zinc dependent phospholipase C family protein [Gemmatimonadetes bacterium]|nr:zinc dependent phospholipase C family protein [Gemmatimonadota bacterium]
MGRTLAALALALVGVACWPAIAHAWTPGTHIFLGESVLANLAQLPAAVADLLRAFPYDFLYGNIAADTSIAKKYAPVGRHCHAWHVGQEIYDLADSEPLRAFGLGYLSHLAADTVAHNFFVPRQLVITSRTIALGHSYWETRFETHLGEHYARGAMEVVRLDHRPADAHLDRLATDVPGPGPDQPLGPAGRTGGAAHGGGVPVDHGAVERPERGGPAAGPVGPVLVAPGQADADRRAARSDRAGRAESHDRGGRPFQAAGVCPAFLGDLAGAAAVARAERVGWIELASAEMRARVGPSGR